MKNRSQNTVRVAGNYNCWTSAKAKICSTMEDLPEIETDPRVFVGAEQRTKRPRNIHVGPSLFSPTRYLTNLADAGGHTFEIPPHLSNDHYFIEQPIQGTKSLARRLEIVLRPSPSSIDDRRFWQCLYGSCTAMLVIAECQPETLGSTCEGNKIGSAKIEIVKQSREARKRGCLWCQKYC